jgi:hypothetical protein
VRDGDGPLRQARQCAMASFMEVFKSRDTRLMTAEAVFRLTGFLAERLEGSGK